LPDELVERVKRPANAGAWVKSWAAGESTYDELANYPPRLLSGLEIIIQPHKEKKNAQGRSAQPGEISMRELVL
jgi:hypothetical protein